MEGVPRVDRLTASDGPIKSAKVPILFLIYHRPQLTRRVLERIRDYGPERLYIVADGPNAKVLDDENRCSSARAEAAKVDWNCQVKTLYREENLGCGKSVKTGIDWFFSQEEMGIILEDDTVPDPSFFRFCETLLVRFEDDERVGQITGFRSAPIDPGQSTSFSFANSGSTWGWATWARSWRHMDFEMTWLGDSIVRAKFFSGLGKKKEISYWDWAVSLIKDGKVDTWDFQWAMSLRKDNLLTIVPRVSLVGNMGFNEDATHPQRSPSSDAQTVKALDFPLTFPNRVEVDLTLENLRLSVLLDRRKWVVAGRKLLSTIRLIADYVYAKLKAL